MIRLIFFALVLSLLACQPSNKPADDSAADDFETFYQKFHSDSAYQMEHIVFPLPGLPAEVDSTTLKAGAFKWQKENWKLHKDLGDNPEFKQEFVALTDDIIIERLSHKRMENVGITRRFSKIGGEWHLIYYAGLNYFE